MITKTPSNDLETKWLGLQWVLEGHFGKKPDLNAVLYLVGVQELGKGFNNFSKEEKQDLMHIGTCKLLSIAGYYKLQHLDVEGWPHWEQVKGVPNLSLPEQELLLKMMALEYFSEIGLIRA